jgi:CTP:molybdopterin cytidylyltransferase MocA
MAAREKRLPLILLAGGKSSRMGTPKGLVDCEGRPWLAEQLRAFAACGGDRVVVVLGYQADEYFRQQPWLSAARDAWVGFEGLQLTVAVNDLPELGPFSSVQLGAFRICRYGYDGAFVLPIDVPCPERATWAALEEKLPAEGACIPEAEGKGGHPALLSLGLLRRLVQLPLDSPDSRLDAQIHALPVERRARVKVGDRRVGLDLNIPASFEEYRRGR